MVAQRHAFERALHAVIEESGLAQSEGALLDAWEDPRPATPDGEEDETRRGRGEDPRRGPASAAEAVGRMPHDLSPARSRRLELAEELAAHE
nr:hypothetical protein [Kineococcus radiotolerans]